MQSETPETTSQKPTAPLADILVVDDEALVREVLIRKLSSLGYRCDQAEHGVAALEHLAVRRYDLMLSDIMMPEMGGIALMREALRLHPDLAIILVTSVLDLDIAVGALKNGAYDFIAKPFSLEEVTIAVARGLEKRRLLIENLRYQQTLEGEVVSRTRQFKQALEVLEHTYHSTLVALGTALESRDARTDRHSFRVTLYAARLARQMGLKEAEIREIEQGALLHDIGKIGVPDALLRKQDKLTESEWALMRNHPLIGYRILAGIKTLRNAAKLVLHHQEHVDGTGYPAGLKGEEIMLGARIFAVADTLDCITSNRPFQRAATFEAAREEIQRVAGTQLDPDVVAAFEQVPLDDWRQIREAVATDAVKVR
jgi:response regulator RpfG family c-di-GMP phosphodiesterase